MQTNCGEKPEKKKQVGTLGVNVRVILKCVVIGCVLTLR